MHVHLGCGTILYFTPAHGLYLCMGLLFSRLLFLRMGFTCAWALFPWPRWPAHLHRRQCCRPGAVRRQRWSGLCGPASDTATQLWAPTDSLSGMLSSTSNYQTPPNQALNAPKLWLEVHMGTLVRRGGLRCRSARPLVSWNVSPACTPASCRILRHGDPYKPRHRKPNTNLQIAFRYLIY